MIAQLLRREQLSVPVVGFAIALIWALAHPGGDGFPVAAVLFPILMLFAGSVGRRTTLFQAALPIPARSLFAARLLFFLIAVWTPLVTLAAALLLRPHGSQGAAELLAAGMAVTLAGVVVLTARIDEFDAHVSRLGFFTIALGGLGFAASQSRYALPVALFFGAVAAARLVYIWPRVPAGFQAAPVQPVRARSAAVSARPISNAAVLPLLRSAMPRMAVLMLVVAVFQAVIGMWPYAVIVLSGTPAMARRGMRWIWGLPIGRRALLWLSIGPSVACLAAGVIVSGWFQPMRPRLSPVSVDDNAASPPEVWRFARGAAPVTRAPWGEAVEPRAVRLPGVVAYNPYTIRPQSSRAFVDWQHQRALAAIHGTPDAEERPISLRYPAMALTTALIVAFALLVFFAGALREWRPIGRLPKRWQTSLTTAAALLAFLPIAVMEGRSIAGGVRMSSSDLVSALALRLSAALPGGGWVVTAVALLIAAAACLVVDRQFAGLELGHAAEVVLDRLKGN